MEFFYRSEKSGHNVSGSSKFIHEFLISFQPKILFQISSIFSKILSGLAYLFTSKPNNLHKIGKRNIDNTVIITQMIAYLIVLIAGLILSSFPPDNINSNPHHKMNTIDNTHANKTNNEIASKIKSQNAIDSQNIGFVCVDKASACVINIFILNY